MRGAGVTLAVALLLALGVAVPVAGASGPTANQCAQVDQSLATPCYGIDVIQRDAGATVDPHAHDAEVAAYESSWVHRALGLQYALANDLGTRDAPWVGTHNSFNSIAEM